MYFGGYFIGGSIWPPTSPPTTNPNLSPSRQVADRRHGILYLFQPILWTDVKRVRFTSGYQVKLFILYNMLPSEGNVFIPSKCLPPPSSIFILTRKPETRFWPEIQHRFWPEPEIESTLWKFIPYFLDPPASLFDKLKRGVPRPGGHDMLILTWPKYS